MLPWTLGEGLPAGALRSDIDPKEQALIHLAHDWRVTDDGTDANAAGTEALFADAAGAGLGSRVFVSSLSARPDAPNRYGRSKWASEQAVPDATSLRVGLVYGGPQTAMFGLMCRLASFRMIPMVEPRRPVQPIHLNEVVAGILAAADGQHKRVMVLAGPRAIPFETVLRLLAEKLHGRHLRVLPVKLRLALLGCDVVQKLARTSRVDRERVLGLVGTRTLDSTDDLAALGVTVRPIVEGLGGERLARRALLREATGILRAVLGRPVSAALVRRYARAAADGAVARPLLPQSLTRWCEPVGAGRSPLSARFRLAARLIEASSQGEQVLAGGSRAGRLLRLAGALTAEALLLPLRLAAGLAAR